MIVLGEGFWIELPTSVVVAVTGDRAERVITLLS